EDCQRRLEALNIELEIIGREETIGIDAAERRRRTARLIDDEHARLATLEKRRDDEKALVDRILEIRARLRGPAAESAGSAAESAPAPAERDSLLAEVKGLQTRLTDLQGDAPLILPTVEEQAVASVVQDWT